MVTLSKDALVRLAALGVGGLVTAEEQKALVSQARSAIALLGACEKAIHALDPNAKWFMDEAAKEETREMLAAAISQARGDS